MADRSLARRYATAFMQLATEANQVDELGGELQGFYDLVSGQDGALFHALSTPVFTVEERRGVLAEVFSRTSVKGLTAKFLGLLLEKGRFSILPLLVDTYVELAHEKANRVVVRVSTAEPLTPQLEAEVRVALEKVTQKTVILHTKVDSSLIGGMVARVGGTVYDASIRNRLLTLREALLQAQEPAQA
ncbi:MAG: ATP synthase F1 subunit delta [Proteobacteria bacterium]|nr:ATP synthase F1 subunit delta [Pseudomonadota bacterium]